ncbi:uncharacterized protein [Chelonus insularis]|uniref:uncharacterized protein n=1 Tax=Chelonus insularis TaxID=460826 RepID=UPI00158E2ADD|nr:uncharacterized protein LOC118065269 [Chelonus insularis]
MESIDTSRYFVVKFAEKRRGQSLIDLIPRSWLINREKPYMYYYPPKQEYRYLENWVKNRKKPNKEKWIVSKNIEILSGAGDYEQGVRRLNRAYTQENLETEDATLKKQDVPKLNEKEALVLLNEELNLSNKDVQESYSLTKENTRETNFDKQLTSIKAASLKKIPRKRISRHSSFSNSEEREISQNECSYSDQSIDSTIVPPLNKKRKMNLKVSSDSESIEENSQRTGPKSFDSVHSGHNAKRK